MSQPAIDIDQLSPAERLELIGRLWDSSADEQVPLSGAERAPLDDRLDTLDRDGPTGVPWDEIKTRWAMERRRRRFRFHGI